MAIAQCESIIPRKTKKEPEHRCTEKGERYELTRPSGIAKIEQHLCWKHLQDAEDNGFICKVIP